MVTITSAWATPSQSGNIYFRPFKQSGRIWQWTGMAASPALSKTWGSCWAVFNMLHRIHNGPTRIWRSPKHVPTWPIQPWNHINSAIASSQYWHRIEIINLCDISASNFSFGGFSSKLFGGKLPTVVAFQFHVEFHSLVQIHFNSTCSYSQVLICMVAIFLHISNQNGFVCLTPWEIEAP